MADYGSKKWRDILIVSILLAISFCISAMNFVPLSSENFIASLFFLLMWGGAIWLSYFLRDRSLAVFTASFFGVVIVALTVLLLGGFSELSGAAGILGLLLIMCVSGFYGLALATPSFTALVVFAYLFSSIAVLVSIFIVLKISKEKKVKANENEIAKDALVYSHISKKVK